MIFFGGGTLPPLPPSAFVFYDIVVTPATPPSEPLYSIGFTFSTNVAGWTGVEMWPHGGPYTPFVTVRSRLYDVVRVRDHSIDMDYTDAIAPGDWDYQFICVTADGIVHTSGVGTVTVPDVAPVGNVTFGSATYGAGASTFNHTVATDDTAIAVWTIGAQTTVTGVTFNGIVVPLILTYNNFGIDWQLWIKFGPTVGTHAVSVAAASPDKFVAATVKGATAIRSSASLYSSTYPTNNAIASAVGDMVLCSLDIGNVGAAVISANTGSTMRLDSGTTPAYIGIASAPGAAGSVAASFIRTPAASDYVQLAASFMP